MELRHIFGEELAAARAAQAPGLQLSEPGLRKEAFKKKGPFSNFSFEKFYAVQQFRAFRAYGHIGFLRFGVLEGEALGLKRSQRFKETGLEFQHPGFRTLLLQDEVGFSKGRHAH